MRTTWFHFSPTWELSWRPTGRTRTAVLVPKGHALYLLSYRRRHQVIILRAKPTFPPLMRRFSRLRVKLPGRSLAVSKESNDQVVGLDQTPKPLEAPPVRQDHVGAPHTTWRCWCLML